LSTRNTTPADQFELLRRMYNCNWTQLAKRLGTTPNTLRAWRTTGAGASGSEKMHKLFQATLTAADCDYLSLHMLNWANIHSIGGKR